MTVLGRPREVGSEDKVDIGVDGGWDVGCQGPRQMRYLRLKSIGMQPMLDFPL